MKAITFYFLLLLVSLAKCSFSLGDERFNDMEYVIRTLLEENKDLKARIDKLEALQDRVSVLEENCGISDGNAPANVPENYGVSSMLSDDVQVHSNNETDDDIVVSPDRNIPPNKSPKQGKGPSNKELNTGHLSKRAAGSEVAFHVYLSGQRCYSNHETFVFDREPIDLVGGYNIKDGIFDAPAAGLYVFSWTVTAEHGSWFSAELIVDGVVKGVVMTDPDTSGSGSGVHPATGVVLANVNAGDHVFIRFIQGHGCYVKSDAYVRTSFTGWLLL